MKRILGAFLITLFFLCSFAFAEQSRTPQFEFVVDFIDYLGWIKGSFERLKMTADNADGRKNDIEETTELMAGMKRANTDLMLAKKTLEKHQDSQVKIFGDNRIQEAVQTALGLCDSLIEFNNAGIKKLEELYSKENLKNLESFDVGKYMRETSEISAGKQDVMSALPMLSVYVSNFLVSDKANKEGKIHALLITASERKKLMDELIDKFGLEIKEGLKSGQDYITASAAGMYQMLNQQWIASGK